MTTCLPESQSPFVPLAIILSTARSRALSLLHSEYPIHPDIFAHYMWPESSSWSSNDQPGRAIRAKANTFLARLERDGLVTRCGDPDTKCEGYVISSRGAAAVSFWCEALGAAPDTSGFQLTTRVS
jgi:hypothetical protein